MADDYDQLSALGKQQGYLLGAYWGQRGKQFNKVFVGSQRRHQQTFNAFAEGFERFGSRLAQPKVIDAFSEHGGFQFVSAILPSLVESDPFVAAHYRADGMEQKTHLAVYEHVILRWAAGDFSAETTDTWQAFRSKVALGMAQVIEATGRGQTAIVFTSGGTISAAMGNALEMDDIAAVRLNWVVRNSAYAEFYSRDGRLTLFEFNAVPHLKDAAMLTYI